MEGKYHKIEFWNSSITSKKKLTVDAKELLNNKADSDDFSYSFKLDKHFLSLIKIDEEYELKIDNRLFTEIMNDERCGKLKKKQKSGENGNYNNYDGDSPNKREKNNKTEQEDIDFYSRAFEFNDEKPAGLKKEESNKNRFNFNINSQKKREEDFDDDDDIMDDFDVEEIKKNLNQNNQYNNIDLKMNNKSQFNSGRNNNCNINNQMGFFDQNINFRNNNQFQTKFQNDNCNNKNQYQIFNNNYNNQDNSSKESFYNNILNTNQQPNIQSKNINNSYNNNNNMNNYGLFEVFSNNNNNNQGNFQNNNNLLNFNENNNMNNYNNYNLTRSDQAMKNNMNYNYDQNNGPSDIPFAKNNERNEFQRPKGYSFSVRIIY